MNKHYPYVSQSAGLDRDIQATKELLFDLLEKRAAISDGFATTNFTPLKVELNRKVSGDLSIVYERIFGYAFGSLCSGDEFELLINLKGSPIYTTAFDLWGFNIIPIRGPRQ